MHIHTERTQAENSDWIIDSQPGAREALNNWRQLQAEGEPLRLAANAAAAALVGKIRHAGQPGDTRMVPAPGVTTAEFDQLLANKAAAKAAQDAHSTKAHAARLRFEKLISPVALRADDSFRRLAARRALDMQAAAVAAWATLKDALEDRDDAVFRASIPAQKRIVDGVEVVDRRVAIGNAISSAALNKGAVASYFDDALAQFRAVEHAVAEAAQ